MKLALCALLAICAVAVAEERNKRQVNYQFPGPRQAQDDPALYQQQAPRRQYQAQPAQAYAAAPRAAPQPRTQSYGAPPQQAAPRRPAAATRTRYAEQDVEENPEEDKGPDALTLLLQESKFTCGSKKDGYYADNTVSCQVFHYCVGGAKHSWMCPSGTLFHQVHLNCVADNQDATLCGQADKFYFVNDYLHKELETRGPNNTVQYAQRYYPDGYIIGDTFVPPSQGGRQQYADDQYQQPPPQQARPQPAQYRPQAPPPQQYAPAGRPNYGAAPPQRYASQAAPPQRYVPQAAAPPARAAPQNYGYAQDQSSGVPDIDDLPTLPQIPQQQPRRPAPSRAAPVQSYGGAYQVSGARQVRYDDDRGY